MADGENAEEQENELLALQGIFEEEEICVESAEPGAIAFTIDVSVDLGSGPITLWADVEGGAAAAAAGGSSSSTAPAPAAAADAAALAAAPSSVQELVQQQLLGGGRAAAPAKPRLQRSVSGAHAQRAEVTLKHLSPLTLHVFFPAEYPSAAPPDFHLVCGWMSSAQLARLCSALDEEADKFAGAPVVYSLAEFLKFETKGVLGLTDTLELAVSGEPTDVRAVGDCVDPMATMMELSAYDRRREVDLWQKSVHTCQICFSEKAGSQFVHLGGCDHSFCTDCMSDMAKLFVKEGTIIELKCPVPDCRAELGARTLEQLLGADAYERWERLKTHQILDTLEGVVFCPRCEENGRDVPTFVEPVESEDIAPIAHCQYCGYVFCGKCFAVAHQSTKDCISEEDRLMAAAIRREQDKGAKMSTKERTRARKEKEVGKLFQVEEGEELPSVEATGTLSAGWQDMMEGDEVMSVSVGSRDYHTPIWTKANDYNALEDALRRRPPLVIRIRRNTMPAEERSQRKRVLEELMTLRAIKQDSQPCPRCNVRISRSQGCNHMRCTNCDTHFCYRCGKAIPSDNPYSHFSANGCPTFDTSEVRRMVHEGNMNIDHELEALRQQFGRQENMFAQFHDRQNGVPLPPRHLARGEGSACPSCRQWNARNGGLNHGRCHACRQSFCHHCKKRITGSVAAHFRGEGACPQHFAA